MTPWLDDGDVRLYHGDAIETLSLLADGSVDCVVTSPPYWGLRDYGTGEWEGGDPDCDHRHETAHQKQGATSQRQGRTNVDEQRNENFRDVCGKCGATRVDQQMGLEPTPDEFVQGMVGVFREVRRVLADHGTCWVNLGDSYAGSSMDGGPASSSTLVGTHHTHREGARFSGSRGLGGLKPKDLVGIPWRVAFALQADGWYLRSDIVWSKPNPMPESVTDRPTKAHEYVFLLTKQPRYYFDQEAVREPHSPDGRLKTVHDHKTDDSHPNYDNVGNGNERWPNSGRNVRSVWQIATQPYPEAHFATFPEELARRCILAGCPVRVCSVCGKPSERIVERRETKQGEAYDSRMERAGDDFTPLHQPNRSNDQVPIRYNLSQSVAETVGWSDCGHHALECEDCGTVLDSDYTTGHVEDDSLRGMWVDDSAQGSVGPSQEVLREDMREQAHRTESSDDQGLRDGEGLPDAEASGASDGEPRGLRDGAPAGDGGAPGPDADEGRSGAPSERGEGRQPGGESGSDAEASARPSPKASGEADHLSALRREDHHVGSCPACNGRLVARAEHLRWRAGRVLDPFIGSGTVAKVSRDHARHAIGIDLSADYLELAARRLQQLSLLAAPT